MCDVAFIELGYSGVAFLLNANANAQVGEHWTCQHNNK